MYLWLCAPFGRQNWKHYKNKIASFRCSVLALRFHALCFNNLKGWILLCEAVLLLLHIIHARPGVTWCRVAL
jgi:hypothetical protein